METLEIASRLNRSDVDNATLDALRITTDRLASEYPFMPTEQLLIEGRQWLRRVVELHTKSLTLAQHREVLALSGCLTLLVGCVEYDTGDRHAAESTRRAALSLATESDHAEVPGGRTRCGHGSLSQPVTTAASSRRRWQEPTRRRITA
ncbi:hypothetical protein [Actinacidiphila sp. bgisy167]|uniref:hypothetical protein n=1 Tax=Actinacidiphila sp. bgisy167 TaxID=3413797 RepID=UPI003D760640